MRDINASRVQGHRIGERTPLAGTVFLLSLRVSTYWRRGTVSV